MSHGYSSENKGILALISGVVLNVRCYFSGKCYLIAAAERRKERDREQHTKKPHQKRTTQTSSKLDTFAARALKRVHDICKI